MTNILLTCLLLTVWGFGLLAFLAFRRIRASVNRVLTEYDDVKTSFLAFVSPEPDGSASPLAKMTDAISIQLARALAAQFKTMLMGKRSGEVRTQNAADEDAAGQQLDVAGLGGLAAIPGLKRGLVKNPGILDLALKFLMRRQPTGETVDSGSNGARPRFRLGG